MTTKKEIIEFCLSFTDTYEDYPFDEEWAAIRHSANKKCFAYVYERNGNLCVNLKCEPFKADMLR
jgi:predicted DNA-binding protein (MmcQ/YjbR family)